MMDVTQHKYLTIFFSKRGQRLRELLADLFSFQRLRWNLAPVGEVPRDVISVFILATDNWLHDVAVVPAFPHPRFVERYLNKPGAELRFAAELADVLECFEHRLLNRVLGIGLVAQDRE